MLELVDKKDINIGIKTDWWDLLREKARKNKSAIEVRSTTIVIVLSDYLILEKLSQWQTI